MVLNNSQVLMPAGTALFLKSDLLVRGRAAGAEKKTGDVNIHS
jgi:hypothetical protein